MTVLSRGARVRRGGRRPGWVLLTALLVLAIVASSALVFTDRVELLKLAVILALWAAVAGAFVSVLYRRQAEADQARARDMKLVYDLQLDREVSARREYELTVESQLRRELAAEIRAQAADEIAALRAELATLRTNLEILFDTDLEQRPALETPVREPLRALQNGEGPPADWVSSDRVTAVRQEEPSPPQREEAAIIDVPEEPLLPPRQPVPVREYAPPQAPPQRQPRHRPPPQAPPFPPPFQPAAQPQAPAPQPQFQPAAQPQAPAPQPQSQPAAQPQAPAPQPQPQPAAQPEPRTEPRPQPEPRRQPEPQPVGWQPVVAEGQWLPPGTVGSHWAPAEAVGPPEPAAPQSGRRRRSEPQDDSVNEVGAVDVAPEYGGRRSRSRHSAEYRDYGVSNLTRGADAGPEPVPPPAEPPPPPAEPPKPPAEAPAPPRLAPAPPPPPPAAPRHRSAEEVLERPVEQDPQSGGQTVADLMARLQVPPGGGGRRRRRDG